MTRRKIITVLTVIHSFTSEFEKKYSESAGVSNRVLLLLQAVSETLPMNLRMVFSNSIKRRYKKIQPSTVMSDELFTACIIDLIGKVNALTSGTDNDRLRAVSNALDAIGYELQDIVEISAEDLEQAADIADDFLVKLMAV